MEENKAITARYLDNPELHGAVGICLMKRVYDRIRGESLAA
ncbi:MAG: hypothetical protein WCP98_19585 [Actinomycetes bacterium]